MMFALASAIAVARKASPLLQSYACGIPAPLSTRLRVAAALPIVGARNVSNNPPGKSVDKPVDNAPAGGCGDNEPPAGRNNK